MVKDALSNLKFSLMVKYAIKMSEMREKLTESVIDGRSNIYDLGYKIMTIEARLSKIAQELQTEKDSVKISELREEERDLNLVLAETRKEQGKEKCKFHMLSKLDEFVSKMDDKKLKKASALYEELKSKNAEDARRTQEYNKLLGASESPKDSDFGADEFMNQMPEDSFAKECDKFMAMLDAPTLGEMCDNLMKAFYQGDKAFDKEMKKDNSTMRKVMVDAPAVEAPVTPNLETGVSVKNVIEKPKEEKPKEEKLDEIELQ